MKKILNWVLVAGFSGVLFLGVSPKAFAAEPATLESASNPTGSFEFFANIGSARPSGYLTTQEALGSYLFGFHIWANNGSFAFEFGGFNADHDTGEFALTNNKSVSVSTFSWMSYIGVYSTDSLKLALGIGPAVVTLSQSSPESRIPFGTFIFAGMARYELNERWNLQFKSQWYEVEQTFSSQTTNFQVWTNTLGVAYNWSVR